MAKGSAQGLWRGKKGTSVFYKIKNSNNAQKQGIRERVYEISNPQSTGQASQRMKMLPAQRLANVLKSVIERGFEGIEYGVKSRQEFLKYALKMTTGFPATEKDATVVYPGRYLIANGTLPKMETNIVRDDGLSQPGFNVENLTDVTTIGDLSAKMLAYNPFLQTGDQITFVVCGCYDDQDNSALSWKVESFIIDETDTTLLSGLTTALKMDQTYQLVLDATEAGFEWWAATATILSRESDNGGHLRSASTLTVAPGYDFLFTNEAYSAARRSYQKKNVAVTSDWPVEPDNTIGGVTVVDGTFVLSGLTGDAATLNGLLVRVKVREDNGALAGVYVYNVGGGNIGDNALVSTTDQPVTYTDYSGGEDVGLVTSLKPSDVPALADLPIVNFMAGA